MHRGFDGFTFDKNRSWETPVAQTLHITMEIGNSSCTDSASGISFRGCKKTRKEDVVSLRWIPSSHRAMGLTRPAQTSLARFRVGRVDGFLVFVHFNHPRYPDKSCLSSFSAEKSTSFAVSPLESLIYIKIANQLRQRRSHPGSEPPLMCFASLDQYFFGEAKRITCLLTASLHRFKPVLAVRDDI